MLQYERLQRKEWPAGGSPSSDRAFIQLHPCLVFPPFSFVTSSMTFLLATAALKRQAGHISDGGYYRRLSWRGLQSPRKPRLGSVTGLDLVSG